MLQACCNEDASPPRKRCLCGCYRRPLELVGRSAGNVEPLVDARVNGSGRLVLALGNVELARVGTVGRVRDGSVGPATSLVKVIEG
jgi:hypothetical protein